MNTLLVLLTLAAASGPARFVRHDVGSYPGGYQVAVADVNADGRPDVIAVSTAADRVDWFENPTWKRRPVARTDRNIDLAPRDIDGDGTPEIALASGFYFSESTRGGEIRLLCRPRKPGDLWQAYPVGADPVAHRLRWGDLDGDGRPELVHAPVFGPGSDGARNPKPAHLWAFRLPERLSKKPWAVWKIDESLTVLHGVHVADLDRDGRDEILTASFEGICRFDFEGRSAAARWRKIQIAPGAKPVDQKPGASRGSSEVVPGHLGPKRPFIAAIEPWHGHEVVVYVPGEKSGSWRRHVLDRSLEQGHALVVADFDGDGVDEIVAGWRGGEGGLVLYDFADAAVGRRSRIALDSGIKVEGAVAADLNADGKLDLVAIAGRSNDLAWYENLAK